MKIFCFALSFLLLTVSGSTLARDSQGHPTNEAEKRECSVISKEFPGKGNEVLRLIRAGKEKEAALVTLEVTRQARRIVNDRSASVSKRINVAAIFVSSWHLVLERFIKSPDNELNRRIMVEWEEGLGNPVSFSLQVRALNTRTLINKQFWASFLQFKDTTTIEAVCAWMNELGEPGDIPYLRKKIGQTKNHVNRSYLNLAINWIEYRQHHPSCDPGPASTGPVMPSERTIILRSATKNKK